MQQVRTILAGRQNARIAQAEAALGKFGKAVDTVVGKQLEELANDVPTVVDSLAPRVPVPLLAGPRSMKQLVEDISGRAADELFRRLSERIASFARAEQQAMLATLQEAMTATLRRQPDHLGAGELSGAMSFPAGLAMAGLAGAVLDALHAEEEQAVRTCLAELDRAILDSGRWETQKTSSLHALALRIVAIVVRAVLGHPLSSLSRTQRVAAVKRHIARSLQANLADSQTHQALHDIVARYFAEISQACVGPLRDRLAVTTDDRLLQEITDGTWSAEVIIDDAVQELDKIARRLEHTAKHL
jgi:hypothetical protein